MSDAAQVLQERMHLRLDSGSKRKLERAAAERIIEARERVVLPATDWQAFHEALLAPPPPNPALKRAARRYRERMGG